MSKPSCLHGGAGYGGCDDMRNYAALPHEYIDEMAELTDEEFGHLVRALLRYSMTGEVIEPVGNARFYARRVMMQEDRFQASYNELTQKRSEAGRKGAESRWHGKASLPNGTHSNTETKTKTETKPNNTTLPRSTERRNAAAAAAQTERMKRDMARMEQVLQGGVTGAPGKTQHSGFVGERTSPGTSEISPTGGNASAVQTFMAGAAHDREPDVEVART